MSARRHMMNTDQHADTLFASLANTLMPDAYREDGKLVAFATAAGFFVSFLISEL